MKNSLLLGHLLAIFTIIVWGSTFSSTKALLKDFSAYEILFLRFTLAYICMFIFYPKILKSASLKEEMLFALCGLCGVCLYFLLENIALNYTLASNAGVLVSISPIFTAILGFFILKKSPTKFFIIGFVFALCGIVLIVFSDTDSIEINPLGDFLCILAGLSWAFYTIFLDKLFEMKKGFPTLVITKKIFFYGIIFSAIPLFFNGFDTSTQRFLDLENIFNLMFLGIFASALCYLSWGMCLKILGTLKASAYLYSIPIVAVLVAFLTLDESLTPYIIIGAILVLTGLVLSQKQPVKSSHKASKDCLKP